MVSLNDAQIATKCVEVSKSLLNFEKNLLTYDLENTTTVGDAARLCTTIKNISDRITRSMLAGASASLKIDFKVAEHQLVPLFESMGWVRLIKSGNKISNFTEQIPPIQDVLSSLGKYWKEKEPTTIDEATVNSINLLSFRPYSKDALISELSLNERDFQITLNYGESGGYLGRFTSETHNIETVWSPHYWSHNTTRVLDYLKKCTEQQLNQIRILTENVKRT